ncbi:MAG: TonB family protein [Xanthobacteraceae bacterium]
MLLQVDRPPTLVVEAASRIAGPDTSADLTNVIAFAPWRRNRTVDEMADDPVVGKDDRSATLVGENNAGLVALLLASCLVHAGMLAFLNRDPQPLADAGTAAISVEILEHFPEKWIPVFRREMRETSKLDRLPLTTREISESALGEAGDPSGPARLAAEASPTAHDTSPPETMAAAEDSIVPSRENRPSTAPETTTVDREATAAARDASSEAKPVTEQEADVPAPQPPPTWQTSEPTPAHPVAMAPPRRDSGMPERSAEPVELAPLPTKPGPRPAKSDHIRPAARPTRALTGPDAGEPATAMYLAAVAAHLGRFWQLPADVLGPGERRSGTVRFIIDGAGRATGLTLLHATGVASLDAESLAMVRRASPFSRPPGGRPMTVSVPLTFSLP